MEEKSEEREIQTQTDNNKENLSNSMPPPQEPPMNQSINSPETHKNPLPLVEITYSTNPKPYLGGFKSLKTGLTYHHAFAQTDQIPRDHKTKYHRDVIFNLSL